MHPSIDMPICHATSVCHVTSPSVDPSVDPSVCHVTSPSINPSVHHAHHATSPSVNPSICHAASLSVDKSVHHVTHPYIDTSIHPVISLSDLLSLSDCRCNNSTSLSDCQSMSDHLYKTLSHPSAHLSSVTTKHLHDSSQSLSVVNMEQSHKAKKFHRPLLTMTYFYVI